MKNGVRRAVPEMPLSIAAVATATQAGGMNR